MLLTLLSLLTLLYTAYTVDPVYTVDMVKTVDMVYTVDMVPKFGNIIPKTKIYERVVIIVIKILRLLLSKPLPMIP